MATTADWLADVRRYASDADEDIVAGVVRYCGIALRKRDSSLVSFSDAAEIGRVRERFCKKKLGLTHSDSDLDAVIAKIGDTMKGDRTKNRVTVYYLLAHHFDKLPMFLSAAAKKARAAGVGATNSAQLAEPSPSDQGSFVSEGSPAHLVGAGSSSSAPSASPPKPSLAQDNDASPSAAPAAASAPPAAPLRSPASEPLRAAEPSTSSTGTPVHPDHRFASATAGGSSTAPRTFGSRTSESASDHNVRTERRYAAVGADEPSVAGEAPAGASVQRTSQEGSGLAWWMWILVILAALLFLWLLLRS